MSDKVIDSKEAATLISKWRNNPIQSNRDEVFYLLIQVSKAVIGKIQTSYKMKVKNYESKVSDATLKLMETLDKKPDLIPNNVISWAYLYVLGVIFNNKLVQMESELVYSDLEILNNRRT